MVVQADAFTRIVTYGGIVLEPVLPVGSPCVQGDAQSTNLRRELVREVSFGIETELVEDPSTNGPDLDLANKS